VLSAYLAISFGVVVAIIYPLLRAYVTNEFPPGTAGKWPPWVLRYGGLLLFSLITGLIALAVWDSANPDASPPAFLAAFLIGFGWEATVEKLLKPPVI
jgi:hypothetical protein